MIFFTVLNNFTPLYLFAGHQLLEGGDGEAEGLDLVVRDGVVAEVASSVRALLHRREADDGLACSRWIVNG